MSVVRIYHVAHTLHDEIRLLDVDKGLARDFAAASVFAEDLHDAHAGVDVYFAPTRPIMLCLVHFRGDIFTANVSMHASCVANVDGLGVCKVAVRLLILDCVFKHETHSFGSVRHVDHERSRAHGPDEIGVHTGISVQISSVHIF